MNIHLQKYNRKVVESIAMLRMHSISMDTDLSSSSNCSIHTCSSQSSFMVNPSPSSLRNILHLEKLPSLLASYMENCTMINTKWLTIAAFFCISVKTKVLFEHSICFVSLAATRYLTSRRIRFNQTTCSGEQRDREIYQNEDYPLSTTSSYESNPRSDSRDEISILKSDTVTKTLMTSNLSIREPSATIFSEESQDSIKGSAKTESISSLESPERSSPKEKFNLLGVYNFEDEVDEWGHFADIHSEDTQKVPDFDPFRSITKNMMRKRGHKLSTSINKLSQLQEDIMEEADEENE